MRAQTRDNLEYPRVSHLAIVSCGAGVALLIRAMLSTRIAKMVKEQSRGAG